MPKHHIKKVSHVHGGKASYILEVSSRWRWVPSFTLWSHFMLVPLSESPGAHCVWGWVDPRDGL